VVHIQREYATWTFFLFKVNRTYVYRFSHSIIPNLPCELPSLRVIDDAVGALRTLRTHTIDVCAQSNIIALLSYFKDHFATDLATRSGVTNDLISCYVPPCPKACLFQHTKLRMFFSSSFLLRLTFWLFEPRHSSNLRELRHRGKNDWVKLSKCLPVIHIHYYHYYRRFSLQLMAYRKKKCTASLV